MATCLIASAGVYSFCFSLSHVFKIPPRMMAAQSCIPSVLIQMSASACAKCELCSEVGCYNRGLAQLLQGARNTLSMAFEF